MRRNPHCGCDRVRARVIRSALLHNPCATPWAVARPQHKVDSDLLYQRYQPALLAFFMRRVRDRSEAEDLTQEVFINLATVRTGAIDSVEAYVFRIAANLLRDRERREKVRAVHYARVERADGANVDVLDPPRVHAGRKALWDVADALEELSPKTRAIFLLLRLERLSQADIASRYGISVSAVQKHLLRAMSHLAQRMGSAS
jgi:RNA polymerase sigma factor (sigma-70 family)